MVKESVVNDLLLSIAAVITFLSVEHFLVSRGYTSIAGLLFLVGILLVVYSNQFDKAIPTQLINKKIILTMSHILIFISLKLYLDPFLDQLWIPLFIVGVVLINKSHVVASLFKKK